MLAKIISQNVLTATRERTIAGKMTGPYDLCDVLKLVARLPWPVEGNWIAGRFRNSVEKVV